MAHTRPDLLVNLIIEATSQQDHNKPLKRFIFKTGDIYDGVLAVTLLIFEKKDMRLSNERLTGDLLFLRELLGTR